MRDKWISNSVFEDNLAFLTLQRRFNFRRKHLSSSQRKKKRITLTFLLSELGLETDLRTKIYLSTLFISLRWLSTEAGKRHMTLNFYFFIFTTGVVFLKLETLFFICLRNFSLFSYVEHKCMIIYYETLNAYKNAPKSGNSRSWYSMTM